MKMKLNNKGFTLVEVIAAVAILSILMGVAIGGVSSSQRKARQESYEAMETSTYSAAQNYIQKHSSVIPTTTGFDEYTSASALNSFLSNSANYKQISVQTLVDEGLLPELKDPTSKTANCSGQVYITKVKGTGSKLDTYSYLVDIRCHDYQSKHKVKSVGADGIKGTNDDSETTTEAKGVIFLS